MKYSEVIKAFENGSTKTYEATDNYKRHEMSISGSGYFHYKNFKKESRKEIESSVPAGGFSGNICRTLDWHEVTQPVTWQEAIEAWANGKTIFCKLGEKEFTYNGVYDFLENAIHHDAVMKNEIRNGKWFIKED